LPCASEVSSTWEDLPGSSRLWGLNAPLGVWGQATAKLRTRVSNRLLEELILHHLGRDCRAMPHHGKVRASPVPNATALSLMAPSGQFRHLGRPSCCCAIRSLPNLASRNPARRRLWHSSGHIFTSRRALRTGKFGLGSQMRRRAAQPRRRREANRGPRT